MTRPVRSRPDPASPTRRRRSLRARSAGLAVLLTAATATLGAAAGTVPASAAPRSAPTQSAAATQFARFELSVNRWAINTGRDAGTTVNGADAITWSWSHPHDWNSQWLPTYGSDGWFEFRNRWSNQCLDVEGTGDGADLEQQDCDGTRSQRWKTVHDGSGANRYYLVNKWATEVRGHQVGATASSTNIGARVELYRVHGWAEQVWRYGVVYA